MMEPLAGPRNDLWRHHDPKRWKWSLAASAGVHVAALLVLMRGGVPAGDAIGSAPALLFGGGGGGGGGGGENILYFQLPQKSPGAAAAMDAPPPAPPLEPPPPEDETPVARKEPPITLPVTEMSLPPLDPNRTAGDATEDRGTNAPGAAGPGSGGDGGHGPGTGGGIGAGRGPGAGSGTGPGAGGGAPRPLHLVVPRLPGGVDAERARGATVLLQVEVLPDGRVGEVRIERGSRDPALDRAGFEAARRMRYAPLAAGLPRDSRWTRVELRF
ncbi:hypothetical protein BH18GEM1_BH18GEM1_09270 [soil metagenome]